MMEKKHWKLNRIPFYDELSDSKVILLAGCGGGYDIYSGIPLFINLREMGYTCYLWNLAFTSNETLNSPVFRSASEPLIQNVLWKVTGNSNIDGRGDYFPEFYLSQFLQQNGIDNSIFTASKTGVTVLKLALQKIIDEYHIDTCIMIDGGTDSLMQGDEEGLGTPHEDMLSIKSLFDCKVNKKFLVCLGFGIDAFHDVCHSLYLENVAEMIREEGYLGVFTLMREMPEAELFEKAVKYAASQMEPSIVQSSVMNAVLGKFGDVHFTTRTRGSKLFINPLMGMYWCFRLEVVAKHVKYLHRLENTKSFSEIDQEIRSYRSKLEISKLRDATPFPH